MKTIKEQIKEFEKKELTRKKIGLIFLGVGLILFVLNISSLLSVLPISYNYVSFDFSTFSSVLIIIYSVYMIENKW